MERTYSPSIEAREISGFLMALSFDRDAFRRVAHQSHETQVHSRPIHEWPEANALNRALNLNMQSLANAHKSRTLGPAEATCQGGCNCVKLYGILCGVFSFSRERGS